MPASSRAVEKMEKLFGFNQRCGLNADAGLVGIVCVFLFLSEGPRAAACNLNQAPAGGPASMSAILLDAF